MIAGMTSDAGVVRRFALDNGLQLVVEPMPWLPTVSVNLLFPMGAVGDPAGRDGSAAVLYDWLQRGAGDLDSRALADRYDALGIRRGGAAARQTTTLQHSMLAEAFADALTLLADGVRRPRFDDDDFESARSLVQQELASLADQPTQLLFEGLASRFFASAHGRSPYGSESGLAALTPDSVRQDAAARLVPQGAVLAVAGGVDPTWVAEQVEARFGNWRGSAPPEETPRLHRAARHHVEADSAQVQIGLAYRSEAPTSPDWYRQALALSVLSGGSGSRLYTEVRERRGLVYSVSAAARSLRGFGYTVGYAGTTPERANETLEVMLAEIGRLREGVEAEELERARTGLLSSLVMQGESSGARAGSLAHDSYLRGTPRSLAEVKRAVSEPDVAAVNDFLAAAKDPQPTVVTLGPGDVAVAS
jgi:predicted Zn-dependent peptidase